MMAKSAPFSTAPRRRRQHLLTVWDYCFPLLGLTLASLCALVFEPDLVTMITMLPLPLLLAAVRAGLASAQYPHMKLSAQFFFGLALIALMIFEMLSSAWLGFPKAPLELTLSTLVAYFAYLGCLRVSLGLYYGPYIPAEEEILFRLEDDEHFPRPHDRR